MEINLTTMPFGNGAGSVKSPKDVERACKSPMTRITVGSITCEPRTGNIGDIYYFHPQEQWSINSLGLPNVGMVAYRTQLPEMARMTHASGKELWASISGFSPEEYAQMAADCFAAGVDGIEVNLSCPNVWQGAAHAEIPALNPTLALKVLEAVTASTGARITIAVKLSPTDDLRILVGLNNVLRNFSTVSYVTACNTIPNQTGIRVDGKPALSFRSDENDTDVKHVGGLAGRASFIPNIKMVEKLRRFLPNRIQIIGLGGIFAGEDAFAYINAGASGFQCTTSYLEYGERVFVDILTVLDDRLEMLYS